MSSIFSSVLTGSFSVGQYLLCLLFAGLCGAVAALALSRESTASRSFLVSLVVLPIIVTTVIQTLIMVIHRYRESHLRSILTNHIAVQVFFYFLWLRQILQL